MMNACPTPQIHKTLLETVMQKLELITLLILNRLATERQLREQRKNQELEDGNPKDSAAKQDRNPAARNELSIIVVERKARMIVREVGP